MPMHIRYDCVISTPLHVLIERLDDGAIYNAATGSFATLAKTSLIPTTMFIPLQMNVPLPNIHAATIDTSDPAQFIPGGRFGFYVYNGTRRISGLEPAVMGGSKITLTVDDQVVYTSP